MDTEPARSRPAKRGRRQGLPDPAAGPVAALAYELTALKLRAGDPSYEVMRSRLGAAASKSALSAAARGRDLPSWETVWEFVRCLADPGTEMDSLRREWRDRWEAARVDVEGVVSPAGGVVPPEGGVVPREGVVPPERVVPPEGVVPPPRGRSRFPIRGRERRILTIGLAIGATAGASMWLLVAASSPAAPPIEGDAVAFVGDVTIPDGTLVRPGDRFVKTWSLRNTGTVSWVGRYLVRLPSTDGGGCRTPDRVPVPSTEPGAVTHVSVVVDAPGHPSSCKVYWKLADERNRPYFPLGRPMFFDVVVAR